MQPGEQSLLALHEIVSERDILVLVLHHISNVDWIIMTKK